MIPDSPEDRICEVCKKDNADHYADTDNGVRLFFHEHCLLTPEQTQAMIRLQEHFRNRPAEEH